MVVQIPQIPRMAAKGGAGNVSSIQLRSPASSHKSRATIRLNRDRSYCTQMALN